MKNDSRIPTPSKSDKKSPSASQPLAKRSRRRMESPGANPSKVGAGRNNTKGRDAGPALADPVSRAGNKAAPCIPDKVALGGKNDASWNLESAMWELEAAFRMIGEEAERNLEAEHQGEAAVGMQRVRWGVIERLKQAISALEETNDLHAQQNKPPALAIDLSTVQRAGNDAIPEKFTVSLTGPQAAFLRELAAEFRADPGDMLAALALGSVAGLDNGGQAVTGIHSQLYEVLVMKNVPQVALPLNEACFLGLADEDEQEGKAA